MQEPVEEQIEETELEIANLDYDLGKSRHDEGKIASIAESIRLNGQLHPILVHRTDGGRFKVDAGEGRIAANLLLGRKRVYAHIYPNNPDFNELRHIDENLIRTDLNDVQWDQLVIRRLALIKKLDPNGKAVPKRSPGGKFVKLVDTAFRAARKTVKDGKNENLLVDKSDQKRPTQVVAEIAGVSESDVYRAEARESKAADEVKQEYHDGKLSRTQVDEIIKIPDKDVQAKVLPMVTGKTRDETRDIVAKVLSSPTPQPGQIGESLLDREIKSALSAGKVLLTRAREIRRLISLGAKPNLELEKSYADLVSAFMQVWLDQGDDVGKVD